MHERVEHGLSADDDAVVRRIDGEFFGPEPLNRRQVPVQRGNPFLIVQSADDVFIDAVIHCLDDYPWRQA